MLYWDGGRPGKVSLARRFQAVHDDTKKHLPEGSPRREAIRALAAPPTARRASGADVPLLVRARQRLIEARALVGSSNHDVSLSLYAKDPEGLEFEIFWTVPDGKAAGYFGAGDLEGELARRGVTIT